MTLGPRAREHHRLRGVGESQGDDITTGFNPQFLLDGLQVIDEAVVELAFTVSTKPVVISGSVSYTHLKLPTN